MSESIVRKKDKKLKILFICTGNTCRSPMAETILKKHIKDKALAAFSVGSAGLYARANEPMSDFAAESMRRLGYPARKHRAKRLTAGMAANAHMIVCMTDGHKARVEGKNVFTVAELTGGREVGDPFGQPLEAYLAVARYLEYAVDDIIDTAIKLQNLCREKKQA